MGMHRSGTSLVARLLAAAGVHMGADRNVHDESELFRDMNRTLLGAGHADWDWPLAILPVLEDGDLCTALAERVAERCQSRDARGYLGRRFGRASLLDQTGPWGWKDPRNTLTLPIWLRVFPQAKVVNVYRDGVDVAASLVARERRRRLHLDTAVRSSRCLDPERAFALWSEYLEVSLQVTEELPPTRVRDVRYESLIAKPEKQVADLLHFAGVGLGGDEVRKLVSEVDRERGERFRAEPEWIAFRRRKSQHPLMQRLDYGEGA
jgi:hypothetical protein